MKQNTETLTDAIKEVRLKVNAEKNKYMLLSFHRNVAQTHDINIANKCFENAAQLKYLGSTVTNRNCIQQGMKRRLDLGNACYHSVQNLLSSRLLSKNIKIRIYKTIILPVVLHGCEILSTTLRVEQSLMVFEKRMLRRIFEPKRNKMTEGWSFINCTLRQEKL
jgi:hypothetical protein